MCVCVCVSTHVAWFYGRHGDIGVLEPSLQSKGYHDLHREREREDRRGREKEGGGGERDRGRERVGEREGGMENIALFDHS